MTLAYPVQLTPSEEGGYVVTLRDLSEVITQGETEDEAMEQAVDALDEALAYRMAKGMVIPEPSSLSNGERLVSPSEEFGD